MASPNRVAQLAGVTGFKTLNNSYATTSPGPTGSALMSFFCVCTPRRLNSVGQYVFARSTNSAVGGWGIGFTTNGVPAIFVVNSTPAAVNVIGTGVPANQPLILLCTYAAGKLSVWQNGVPQTHVTLGTGYTTQGVPLAIGSLPGPALSAVDFLIHEAGMLDGVDLTLSALTLTAQWKQDLEQGRHLTWPRVAAVNADWYWSARDATAGLGGCASSWTDRYSGSVMTRTGSPQGAAVPARFA